MSLAGDWREDALLIEPDAVTAATLDVLVKTMTADLHLC